MDFTILKQKVFYEQHVRLEPEEHYKIMELVNGLNLSLLKRISDYYGYNIKYEPYEFSDLKREIDEALKISKDEDINGILKELKKVIEIAETDQKTIEVLTD